MDKIKKAEEKFGLIISDYSLREKLKDMSERYNIIDFKILSHWSRSIIGNNYDLNHPDYLEYKKHYNVGDVSWLEKGKTYVNMKQYKGYYKTIIDGEEVMVKDFDEHYQLEVSGYKKKKMNLYLWKDKRVIVGKMFDVIKLDTMEKYEKILIQECIEKGNELYIDFKNTHIEITKQKEK